MAVFEGCKIREVEVKRKVKARKRNVARMLAGFESLNLNPVFDRGLLMLLLQALYKNQ